MTSYEILSLEAKGEEGNMSHSFLYIHTGPKLQVILDSLLLLHLPCRAGTSCEVMGAGRNSILSIFTQRESGCIECFMSNKEASNKRQ